MFAGTGSPGDRHAVHEQIAALPRVSRQGGLRAPRRDAVARGDTDDTGAICNSTPA